MSNDAAVERQKAFRKAHDDQNRARLERAIAEMGDPFAVTLDEVKAARAGCEVEIYEYLRTCFLEAAKPPSNPPGPPKT